MWLIGLRKLNAGRDTTFTGSNIHAADAASASNTNIYTTARTGLHAATCAELYAAAITAETPANIATGAVCTTNATGPARGT